MKWQAVQEKHPDQWVVIKALETYSANDLHCVERIAIIAAFEDGSRAFQTYQTMHQKYPQREFYFVHTSRSDLQFEERHWFGIRGIHNRRATNTESR